MKGLPDIEADYSGEVLRKAIHLSSLAIPVGYYYLGQSTTLRILLPITTAFFLADLARLFLPGVREIYHRLFGGILRAHERNGDARRFNGATYVLLSACLCIWVFPTVVAITAFSILIVSDTLAALVGRRFGTRAFLGKTREGSVAFLASALLVVLLAPKASSIPVEYLVGAAGAVVGALVEALPPIIDDNFSIPLAIGVTMWILYVVFLPALNLWVAV
jgi:dolichol kinase